MVIRFYSQSETHREFSNFAPFAVTIDGASWPTTEHYYQAQKFADPGMRAQIRSAEQPINAKQFADQHRADMRADWDAAKDGVMLRAIRAKFSQHAVLRDLLLSTGDEPIEEGVLHDSYWGTGRDGNGLNRLGEILMQVRAELRSGADESDPAPAER